MIHKKGASQGAARLEFWALSLRQERILEKPNPGLITSKSLYPVHPLSSVARVRLSFVAFVGKESYDVFSRERYSNRIPGEV